MPVNYLCFTDDCGVYKKEHDDRFIKTHPFYVRSNLCISESDCHILEQRMREIKAAYGLHSQAELRWTDYTSAARGRRSRLPYGLTDSRIEQYIRDVLNALRGLDSVQAYFTITQLDRTPQIEETKLMKMHFQDALQVMKRDMTKKKGSILFIADALNGQTRTMRRAVCEQEGSAGFLQEYEGVYRGFYADYPELSCGLQIAGLFAGIFTASLKYEYYAFSQKSKYRFAYDMFEHYVCPYIRHKSYPPYDTYRSGIKEVPNDCGMEIAREMSDTIDRIRGEKQ